MDFLVENGAGVFTKISSFHKMLECSQTMFYDFLAAIAMGKSDDKDYDGDDPSKFRTMSVNTLRKELSEVGAGLHALLEGSYAERRGR